MNDLSKKRFTRSLQYAIEDLASDARCFCYEHDAEYVAVHKQLVEVKNRLIAEYKESEKILRREEN